MTATIAPVITRIPRTLDGCTWHATVDTPNGPVVATARTRAQLLANLAEQVEQFGTPTNPVIADLHNESGWDGAPMTERIANQLDYLTEGFCRIAYNDGIYTPEDIDAAIPVLETMMEETR